MVICRRATDDRCICYPTGDNDVSTLGESINDAPATEVRICRHIARYITQPIRWIESDEISTYEAGLDDQPWRLAVQFRKRTKRGDKWKIF